MAPPADSSLTDQMLASYSQDMSGLTIAHSYVLDAANLFSILTGHELYTSRHEDVYGYWRPRLGAEQQSALEAAMAVHGSHMLGPVLALLVSALPELETLSLAAVLSDPTSIWQRFQSTPYYSEAAWPRNAELCRLLAPVAAHLEADGLESYWFLTDQRYEPNDVLRIAVHEMFHPPYRVADVAPELAQLIADPLFQADFQAKDPVYGYGTEHGFLEENVVEAASLVICQRAGIVPDPIEYLTKREGGVYRTAIALYHRFFNIDKLADEDFTAYFRRVVAGMTAGRLEDDYRAALAGRN